MPSSSLHRAKVHEARPAGLRTVAAALGVICGQLGTLGLFLEFARIPLADQSNNSWIIWATFMTCIASFVVLSAGLLRSAWRPAKPRTQSIRLLLVPMAIYATSWSILSSQALRIDTFLMLDQISWALLFCLSLTSLQQANQIAKWIKLAS